MVVLREKDYLGRRTSKKKDTPFEYAFKSSSAWRQRPLYPTSVSQGEESLFTSFYERLTLEGVGHSPLKERPHSFLKYIEDLTAAAKKP